MEGVEMNGLGIRASRHALIIAVPNARGEKEIPGTIADLNSWQRFLVEDGAGAWEPGEITPLLNPTKVQVLTCVERIRRAKPDYVLVAFSGHGDHALTSATSGFDRLVLGDGECVSETQLDPGTGRTLLVLDACRGISLDLILKAQRELAGMMKFAEDRGGYRAACRQAFDRAVLAAEQGTITLRSCAVGESASEDKRAGGAFTQAFIFAGSEWVRAKGPLRSPADQVLECDVAFSTASVDVTAKFPNQHPVATIGRRRKAFPFAVAPAR